MDKPVSLYIRVIVQVLLVFVLSGALFGHQYLQYKKGVRCRVIKPGSVARDVLKDVRERRLLGGVDAGGGGEGEDVAECKDVRSTKVRNCILYKSIIGGCLTIFFGSLLVTFAADAIASQYDTGDAKWGNAIIKALINSSWLLGLFLMFSLFEVNNKMAVARNTFILGIAGGLSDFTMNNIF